MRNGASACMVHAQHAAFEDEVVDVHRRQHELQAV